MLTFLYDKYYDTHVYEIVLDYHVKCPWEKSTGPYNYNVVPLLLGLALPGLDT